MVTPSERRPSAMSIVSRLRRGASSELGVFAKEARTSARLVIDLEPGTFTVARSGCAAEGADHKPMDMLRSVVRQGTSHLPLHDPLDAEGSVQRKVAVPQTGSFAFAACATSFASRRAVRAARREPVAV